MYGMCNTRKDNVLAEYKDGSVVRVIKGGGEEGHYSYQEKNDRMKVRTEWDLGDTISYYEKGRSGSYHEIGCAQAGEGYRVGDSASGLRQVDEESYYKYVTSFGSFSLLLPCEASTVAKAYQSLTETGAEENIEEQMLPMGVNASGFEDYGSYGLSEGSLVVGSYNYYDSGISDFAFSYPYYTYDDVEYDGRSRKTAYGKNIQSIEFTGAEGGSLLYSISKRMDKRPLEEMENYVYDQEAAGITDAVKLNSSVGSGRARVVMTGYASGGRIAYEVIKVEPKYVMKMKMICPPYENEEDKLQKGYLTECIYRLCKFSGSTDWVRSFEEYAKAQ